MWPAIDIDEQESDIKKWLNRIADGLWSWNKDNTVDINKKIVEIPGSTKYIPVQLNRINGSFICSYSLLESLERSPKIVIGDFYCDNTNITSLKGMSRKVRRDFYCFENPITDPYEYRYALFSDIGKRFLSGNNDVDEIIKEYRYDGTPESKKRVAQGLKLLKELSNES